MQLLIGNWWAFVLRGIVAILFGLLTFIRPGMALLTLIFIFGFYAIADGVFNLIGAFRRTGPDQEPWWALLIEGLFSLIAGFLALFLPGLTALALLYLIAAWAAATGVFEIIAAVRLRRQIAGEWLLALTGVLSILFGLLVAIFPGIGMVTVLIWIGAYAIVFGVLLIAVGIRLRNWTRTVTEAGGHQFPATAP